MASAVKFKERLSTSAIVVHCSATKASMDIGRKEIQMWHVQQGWLAIGYHLVIRRDGTIETGRPHKAIGSHVKGRNHDTIGICLVGGINDKDQPEDNFTDAQKATLSGLLWDMTQSGETFGDTYKELPVVGHRDLDSGKACPSFDVKSWWKAQVN